MMDLTSDPFIFPREGLGSDFFFRKPCPDTSGLFLFDQAKGN